MSKKLKKELILLCVELALFLCCILLTSFLGLDKIVNVIIFALIYMLSAYKVVINAVKKVVNGDFLDEYFLMTVASLGAFIIGEYAEGVAVILFFRFGDWFERYAVGKSRKSIKSLLDIRPESARVVRDENQIEILPEEIQVGEILIVKAGEKIAVDGVVISGNCSLDTKAITGESSYRFVQKNDVVSSGCIAVDGKIEIKALSKYSDSAVAKILDMVENATSKKAKTEKFITKFARVYTPTVVIIALLVAIIPSLITGEWQEWIFKALAFLVVSCPCALVISVPLSFFCAIGGASGKGILIKGSNRIELLARSKTFVMDKTGTITKGEFFVSKVFPADKRDEILDVASVCEKGSNHPLSKCILKECNRDIEDDYIIEEIAGKGIRATRENAEFLAGNQALMSHFGINAVVNNGSSTVVHVAKNGEYLGYIECEDEIKPSSKIAIAKLNMIGKTVMLTGDNESVAKKVASVVGITEYKAGLMPNEKADYIQTQTRDYKNGETLVFIGDGINDAPSLVSADVGVAMGEKGSNVAVESADVVLMYDDINDLCLARKIAKKTMRIVKQNIVFALFIKVAIMLITTIFGANMWLAVFADVGVSLIAILNAMRCAKVKKN